MSTLDINKYKKEVEKVMGCKQSIQLCYKLTMVHPVNDNDKYKEPTVEMFTDVAISQSDAPELSRVWSLDNYFEWCSDKSLFVLLVRLTHKNEGWDNMLKNCSKQIQFAKKNAGWAEGYPHFKSSEAFEKKCKNI